MCVEINKAGDCDTPASIKQTSCASRKATRGSDPLDPTLLNQNVARTCDRCAGSIDDPDVPDQHLFGDWWCVGDRPAKTHLLSVRRAQSQPSVGDEEQSA